MARDLMHMHCNWHALQLATADMSLRARPGSPWRRAWRQPPHTYSIHYRAMHGIKRELIATEVNVLPTAQSMSSTRDDEESRKLQRERCGAQGAEGAQPQQHL